MRIDVLDHGYVEFIEAWGTGKSGADEEGRWHEYRDHERGIIEAARQSTQGSFRGWDTDAKLLHYLHEHRHATPFEFAGMVIEVQAPIFVFREWHRHRTQSYNEMSARYEPLPDLCYVPAYDNTHERAKAAQAARSKQASGIAEYNSLLVDEWHGALERTYNELERIYQEALKCGVPKELARITMPVGHYSRMRASANLRNWLAFLTLRMDPAAQWEIRQFADAVGQCVAEAFPQTWKLFRGSKGKSESQS